MKSREPIYGLDAIRFLAALFVLGWHLAYRFSDAGAQHIRAFVTGVPMGYSPIQDYAQWGWVGVQMFFVISGLVISYSAQGSNSAKFFVGRIARLVPGVLVCTTLMVCIDLFFWSKSPADLVAPTIKSIIFWPFGGWIAPQFWTLPVEIAFYGLVWSLITLKVVEHLDRLAVALIMLTALYWSAIYSGTMARHWQMDTLLLLQHGGYFAIGICLSSADRVGLSPTRIFVILAGIVLAAFDIAFAAREYGVDSLSEPNRWMAPFGIWISTLGLMIISLRWKNKIANLVKLTRLSGLLRTMGLCTYPLYLIHIHVGGAVMTLAFAQHVALVPAVGLGIAVSVAVSVVLALGIEPQVRRLFFLPFRSSSFRIGSLKLLRGIR